MKGVAYLAGGLAAAAVAATCLVAPGYYAYLLGTVATTALLGIGLNVLFGLAGEVSLGQAGFLALGAYGVAILETRIGLDFWAALAISVVSVSIIAALLSVPALRLTGPYLAMVTIAFGFIVESVSIEWAGLTGGSSGIASIPAPFGTGGMALLSCLICALALAGFAWLRRNTLGLAMRAVATAPLAARGIGIAPLQVRTIAFVLAAAAAALAGGLQAALTGFIAPSSFPFSQSILFLLVVVVGGAGRSFGPLAGAVAVSLLPEVLSGLAEYRLLVFGFALLVVLWVAPDGIAGLADKLRSRTSTPRGDVGPEAAFGHLAAAGGVLQVRGVKVAFGGVVAVSGVDFGALAGRITSVIGPNGAGKTTLLNLLSGFQRPDGGRVEIDGLDITGLPAQAVARAGMARTFQTAQPFVGLSVLDNVRLGLMRGRLFGSASSPLARSLLTFVGYTGRDDIASDALPHVDRRLLEIARALATRPAVLLLDEPAAGLDAADTSRLDGVLRAIAAAGIAVVLVEHDMSLVMAVSDEIIVLDAGRRIAAGTPDVVRADPAVRAAYLGDLAPAEPGAPRRTGAVVLDAANLSAGYGRLPVLDHVAVAIGAGETIALLGPNGAGKSTLMKALSGLIRPVSGAIMLKGADLARLPAHRVARAGVVLVPEGRQVFSHLSVVKNMRLGTTRRSGFEASEIEAMLERFPRLRAKLDIPAGLLSGGEQQMLALARGMLAHPEVMLLDEPSLGLAPAIAFELFQQLARLRDEGMTLLVVDQMAGQALAISDRYYVLSGGRVMSSGNARDLDESQLAESYFGPSTEKQAT